MTQMTKAQKRALCIAASNGGVLEVGGLDGDSVRIDVVERCVSAGWLEHLPRRMTGGDAYRLTDAGRSLSST